MLKHIILVELKMIGKNNDELSIVISNIGNKKFIGEMKNAQIYSTLNSYTSTFNTIKVSKDQRMKGYSESFSYDPEYDKYKLLGYIEIDSGYDFIYVTSLLERELTINIDYICIDKIIKLDDPIKYTSFKSIIREYKLSQIIN